MTAATVARAGRRSRGYEWRVSPWVTHTATHPAGSTCTFIRRRQWGQYRGGSSSRAATHAAWFPCRAGSPQRSHHREQSPSPETSARNG